MKMIVRRTALAVCTLVLALILPTAASAACTGFDDVLESADCYESVIYLAECEIAAGTGNDCFSPEQLITVEQWAVMLCRAYGAETIGDSWQDVGRSSVVEAYRQGWLNETALSAPRSPMCRSVLVESAFAAADVPVYDSTLYEGGASLSTADNILRVGRELGLCSDDADTNALVTRGEAAIILHAVLTQSFRIEAPPAPVALVNAAGVNINDYLLALRQVPEPVLATFKVAGWIYRIDFDYISELSKQLDMSCIGATNYSQKTIYISEASATLHEFGHFLDWTLGIPAEHEQLYLAEAQNSGLRDYAKTNAREYFADCFAYWVKYAGNTNAISLLQECAPMTYRYMEDLMRIAN
ncbi:anthrax toxin lethal factor-related metalloendopeptidase [Dysosmobacter sp.]|uniref:anthrax toxin lethal factor-related metalloendopeptidase n=1 Tax=Dysosmobacter sp. TaxID=2591382 RepID=UPI002F923768